MQEQMGHQGRLRWIGVQPRVSARRKHEARDVHGTQRELLADQLVHLDLDVVIDMLAQTRGGVTGDWLENPVPPECEALLKT